MISRVNYMDLFSADERILEIFSKRSMEDMLFFDIETTGLSWKESMVFLIGTLRREMGKWRLEQWFLDDPSCERELLEKFFAAWTPDTFLIHYNGRQFDLPFLSGRCRALILPDPWAHGSQDSPERPAQLDLYQALRPCRKILGLDRLRLTDLEDLLGRPRDHKISGRKCASLYREYILKRQSAQADLLLAHNRQDLLGMVCAVRALAYPALFGGSFHLEGCRLDHDGISADPILSCTLSLESPLPVPFSLDCAPRPWSIRGADRQAQVDFPLENGCLKMYYKDYKDYYYLPKEDTAVHKSVGTYVDRSHRVAATARTCYTRFPCSLEFMRDTERIEAYVRHCLGLDNICSIF